MNEATTGQQDNTDIEGAERSVFSGSQAADLPEGDDRRGPGDTGEPEGGFDAPGDRHSEVPEHPDGYEASMPEGMEVDEGLMGAYREAALTAGMTQEQFQAGLDVYNAHAAAQMQAAGQVEEERIDQLKDEWGNRFNDRIGAARDAVRKLGDPELVEMLEQTRLGNHPVMIKFFHRLSRTVSEDAFLSGPGGAGPQGVPRSEGGVPQLQFKNM